MLHKSILVHCRAPCGGRSARLARPRPALRAGPGFPGGRTYAARGFCAHAAVSRRRFLQKQKIGLIN